MSAPPASPVGQPAAQSAPGGPFAAPASPGPQPQSQPQPTSTNPETLDFPVFQTAPHDDGTNGRWALSATKSPTGGPVLGARNPRTTTRNKLIVLGGVLVAVLIVGFVLVLPALAGGGDSADKTETKPATPTAAPTSASPTPSPTPPRPSASAAGGEYVPPYVPPAPKPTSESPTDEDEYDEGDWNDEWGDDSPWWEDR